MDRELVVRAARDLILRERLLNTGDRAVVAVSGGQDSVCLLDVIRTLAPELALHVHVAHVNHGLRGPQAAEDAAFVARLAGRFGLPFELIELDVGGYRARHRLSLQAAARNARYQSLARLVQRLEGARLLVGHTRDDLVETFLMNLLRGAGLHGLAGIPPRQELRPALLGPPIDPNTDLAELPVLTVVRPLLQVERSETLAYCRAIGIEPRPDPSNALRAFRRNQVRLELLPMLERFNPDIRGALARTAHALRDDLAQLHRVVLAAWERALVDEGRTIVLDRAALRAESPAVRRHLLRLAVERLRGTTEGLTWTSIERSAQAAAFGPTGKRVTLATGIEIEVSYERVAIRETGEHDAAHGGRLEVVDLDVPGSVSLGGVGQLSVEVLEQDRALNDLHAGAKLRGSPWQAHLDADALGSPVRARPRRPGDRMRPYGLGHEKKLQDLLVDAKVPRGVRELVPVVEARGQIAWVPGFRIDERFALRSDSRRAALIRFQPGPALKGWMVED